MKNTVLASLALAAFAGVASANIVYTTGNYSQDFDTLANTGTPAWANDSTLPGWHLYQRTSTADATPVPHVTYATGTGSSNTGQFYSFGSAGTTERALGGVASSNAAQFGAPAVGAPGGWIAVAFVNGNSSTLTDFTIAFRGEQWRDGGATAPAAQNMVLEYGFGATFQTVGAWTAPGGLFDWSSPVFVNTGSGVAVDGNNAGLVPNRGGTVSNLTWNPGDTLWIRWIEVNDVGNDHGLAIDNFGFSATPTPGAAALLGCGLLASTRRRRA
jgi:hypothetical protein